MPPKRPSSGTNGITQGTAASPGRPPKPCASHVCYPLAINRALSKAEGERNHKHDLNYHHFIDSSSPSRTYKSEYGGNPRIECRLAQNKLLEWFDQVKEVRGMPWRKEVDLETLSKEQKSQRGYEVWVSEIMLQQTQVSTVLSYFPRWIARFPTLASLASCTDVEVINSLWKGLGYYSRASRLWAGAKTVVRDYHGYMPETISELEKIEGIGPYSAGAISSIAFAQRVPVVDGNVTRVLSRLTALHAPSTAKNTTQFLWTLAATLVPPSIYETSSSAYTKEQLISHGGKNKPGAWNQALMELGATVCTPKNPKCGECPLREECLAWNEVRAQAYPSTLAKDVEAIEDMQAYPPLSKVELCQLCIPFSPHGSDGEPHKVMRYPMSKEKKKVREEETAVCVLEWFNSSDPSSKRKVLMIKRPEKGLLAGLFDFPALDLVSQDDESSTVDQRISQLNILLKSVIPSLPDNSLENLSLVSATKKPSTELSTVRLRDWGSVLQVYTHQKRLYHVVNLVISSPTLPDIHDEEYPTSTTSPQKKKLKAKISKKRKKSESDEDISAAEDSASGSLVEASVRKAKTGGRAKWVDEDTVADENVGGAMGKIWAIRQLGGPPSVTNSNTVAKLKVKTSSRLKRDPKQGILSFSKEIEVHESAISSQSKIANSAESIATLPLKTVPIEDDKSLPGSKAYIVRKKRIIVISNSDDEEI